jgi:hypothetical protein
MHSSSRPTFFWLWLGAAVLLSLPPVGAALAAWDPSFLPYPGAPTADSTTSEGPSLLLAGMAGVLLVVNTLFVYTFYTLLEDDEEAT